MKFLIISHVEHTFDGERYWAYGPYIREMNIWENYISELIVLAPSKIGIPSSIDLNYKSKAIFFKDIPSFTLIGFKNKIRTLFRLPGLILTIYKAMRSSDHIHLRCPGNMGLLGACIQIFFPQKKKTAKYAGNWDWQSQQPFSYRLQQRILRNTFLTRNMIVLAYGNWNETKNIKPFFTASYSKNEICSTPPRRLATNSTVKLLFVGALNKGKRPFLSLETANLFLKSGLNFELNIYGEGSESERLVEFCNTHKLKGSVLFHGNVNSEEIKKAYQESHFLIFASKSEGWPKVVAESMFWGCLPITTAVSCVPEMVGNGLRGDLVEPNVKEVTARIEYYLNHPNEYEQKCEQGMKWSREFTLEKFEAEIKKLLI